MSSFGSDTGSMGFDTGSIGTGDSNSFNFSTGLGNIDPNSGLNSLNAGLTGPNAGTIPNGYLSSSSNYIPNDSGISSGSLNGNGSFSMPPNSMGQLNAQSLGSALGAGSKIANTGQSSNSGPRQTGNGRVSMHQVMFANPIQDFAGSSGGGSQAGNSLLQLLAKYHPGS